MFSYYIKVKRALDVIGAITCLLIFSPIILVTALTVKIFMGRPVLFKQKRPGMNEQIFTLYKFRSMKNIDESKQLRTDAERIGRFGRLLRSTSLDELPSLWNVLIGDMSFVGPRPLLVEYLPLYSERQRKRHNLRPGITGLAQISGRNSISWNEKIEKDIEYTESISLLLDIRILFRTIIVTFLREGINAEGHVSSPKFSRNDQ